MNVTLSELLENLKSGLLWTARDGTVRFANRDAGARTGLLTGRRLYDPDMARAVAEVVGDRQPREIKALGSPPQPGGLIPDLHCRVIPGLSGDDAFVLIRNDAEAESGEAFSNLMQVIQHELRDPLQQASRALQQPNLASAGSTSPQADVLGPIEQVITVLNKLVDLASLWGSSALLANDRIEIWPLLQSVWAELQPLSDALSVKMRFQAQGTSASLATIYGSEVWMRRVLLECLESALRAERRGATLEIEHVQMGPRALIVFRDCGVFAKRKPGSVDVDMRQRPGAKSASSRGASDQIGFRLCQHIVTLHGGQLREEVEDGQRNFLIDLPTGAPHRTAEMNQADVAQAQRYAADLAALMTRARQRAET